MIEVVINWACDNPSITYNLLYNCTIVTIKLIRRFLTFDFTQKRGSMLGITMIRISNLKQHQQVISNC
jgi:hypothetical protein